MFTINANFIGRFKTGDNIVYNLKILSLLYRKFHESTDDQKKLLCKPIVILIASITEAVLHDFHSRMSGHTSEGIQNIAITALEYIRGKKIDRFEMYINSARKHDLFDADFDYYENLDFLRKLRNRIHIQDTKRILEENERDVFTKDRKKMAEEVIEKIVKIMSVKYPRPSEFADFVDDFVFPWEEHLV